MRGYPTGVQARHQPAARFLAQPQSSRRHHLFSCARRFVQSIAVARPKTSPSAGMAGAPLRAAARCSILRPWLRPTAQRHQGQSKRHLFQRTVQQSFFALSTYRPPASNPALVRTPCGRRTIHALGSLARSIRSRTHFAPPKRSSFSRWAGVMRRLTVSVSSPAFTGGRP